MTGHPINVLAVDDDRTTRLLMQAMVTSLGHQCLLAEDGAHAWQLLQTSAGVEVVVTDWEMPRVDGLELCRRIRERYTDIYIYILLATSMAGPEQAMQGMQAGADDYLIKPLRRHDLALRLTAAERVTSLHRPNCQRSR